MIRIRENYLTRLLQGISVVMLVATVWLVVGAFTATSKAQTVIEAAMSGTANDPNVLTAHLAARKEAVEELKKNNIFMPPPPEPKTPTVSGILGDKALINGKWYGKGEDAAGAKILAVEATQVRIKWKGKKMTLAPMAVRTSDRSSGGPRRPSDRRRRRQPRPAQAEPPTAGNDDLAWMDVPDRLKARFGRRWARMSDERRERFRNRWEGASAEERQRIIGRRRGRRR